MLVRGMVSSAQVLAKIGAGPELARYPFLVVCLGFFFGAIKVSTWGLTDHSHVGGSRPALTNRDVNNRKRQQRPGSSGSSLIPASKRKVVLVPLRCEYRAGITKVQRLPSLVV